MGSALGKISVFPYLPEFNHSWRLRLTPLREFTMMQLMNQLIDKADWETKVRMKLSYAERSRY
jgi:hypothetical protein